MSDGLAGGELKPDDIPKEELLHLCMKLNKRMQAMESKGKELVKKKNTLQTERQKLISLLETTLNTSFHASLDQDIDLNLIEKTWNDWDLSRIAKQKDLERQVGELKERGNSLKVKSQDQTEQITEPNEKLDIGDSTEGENVSFKITKLEAEVERLKSQENQLKEGLKTLGLKLNEKIAENEKLVKESEIQKTTYEEKIVYIQMTQQQRQNEYNTLKADFDKFQRKNEEKEILLQTNKEMLVSLQARLMELEPELHASREKISDLEKKLSSLQLMKYESDNLINSLKQDLKNSVVEREKLVQKSRESEETKFKIDSLNSKIILLSDEINKLKEENDEKSSMIIRLRSELSTSEKNHAVRVAMLATTEATNQELLKKLETKDSEAKDFIDKISNLQINYSSLEDQFKIKTKEYDHRITDLENQIQQEKDNYENQIKVIKATNEENLENIKKDYTKKSAMARTLLSEREEEVRILSQKVQELQDEIKSGAPSERKIFELAQVQSKREALHGIHRDTREIAFQQLQSALASKDFELAQVQQMLTDLTTEITELRKIKQREGINMDYLKNVVIQYMTFPINSSERNALVPVLAMLLQFSPKEMMEIQKSNRDPIWGTRPVKEVKRVGFSNRPAMPVNMNSSHGTTIKPASTTPSSVQSSSLQVDTYQPPIPVPISTSNPTAAVKKVVNQEFFLQNENLGTVSFDLASPARPSTSGKATGAINSTIQQQQQSGKGVTNNNNNTANSSVPERPDNLERKDSDNSDGHDDYELRQKLKKMTSDILDMSLSEDNLLGGSTVSNSKKFIVAGAGTGQDVLNELPSVAENYSSSNSHVNSPVPHDGGAGGQIKQTISGTSIDEHVFNTSSKAL